MADVPRIEKTEIQALPQIADRMTFIILSTAPRVCGGDPLVRNEQFYTCMSGIQIDTKPPPDITQTAVIQYLHACHSSMTFQSVGILFSESKDTPTLISFL